MLCVYSLYYVLFSNAFQRVEEVLNCGHDREKKAQLTAIVNRLIQKQVNEKCTAQNNTLET